jgi:ATP-dependent RNA helicase RhlE
MTFEDLNLTPPLIKALHELGYTTPTTIQERAFSVIMSGKDVLGLAQTGTGKTLAYLLPSLRMMEYSKERIPRMVILVPTRELVEQVMREVSKLIQFTNLVVTGIYGGGNINVQKTAVAQGVDIIVATPGRLIDLMATGTIKVKAIKKLVIDEVDEMLSLGFHYQLYQIIDKLPKKRQNLLFSATMSEEVSALIDDFFKDVQRIEAAPAGTPLDNIEQKKYLVPNFNTKLHLLDYLLKNQEEYKKVLIFVSTKSLADDLYDRMIQNFGVKVGIIHSNKAQNNRFETVRRFRDGSCSLLIATDIIARGLDVHEVSHVFNVDVPELPDTYIHRIGRTGRHDQTGKAITLVSEREQSRFENIEKSMNLFVDSIELPAEVEISTVLTADEMPKLNEKVIQIKKPKVVASGPAFHEKKDKNKKVNVRVSHSEKMMQKYGKPKKRGQKKKK